MDSFWKRLTVFNSNGCRLAALFLEAAEDGRVAGGVLGGESGRQGERNPIVVACHGFTGTKEGGGRALAMGESLRERGFSTLLFDFAGCGESEGSFEEISLSRQIADLGVIVGWCRQEGFDRIILNGRSFGGSSVLGYAARDSGIAAVCTWAAVSRLTDLFGAIAGDELNESPEELVALKGEGEPLYLRKAFFHDLKKHDLMQCAAAIAPRRLLIIHGSADEVVPVEDARLLFEAADQPKELLIVDGADHRFSEHMNAVWECFFRWLKKLS